MSGEKALCDVSETHFYPIDLLRLNRGSLFSLTPGACVCPLFEMAVPMILILSFFLDSWNMLARFVCPLVPSLPLRQPMYIASLSRTWYELHRTRWSGWQMLLRV